MRHQRSAGVYELHPCLPVVALKLCCRSNCILCVSRRSILGPRRSLHQGLLLVDALLQPFERTSSVIYTKRVHTAPV